MVAHEDEERVVEKRVAASLCHETAEREIGVAHGVHATLLRGVGGDPAGRVEKGSVVRDRQDDRVEGSAGGVDRVHFRERPVEDRLVADAPGRPKRVFRKVGLLHHSLHPVRFHIPAHSVEQRASAVNPERAIAARAQELGQREQAGGPFPTDDRDAGQRRQRGGRGLDRADRPVPGRVGTRQESPLRDERVERRREALFLGVKRSDELRPEALLQDDHDVGPSRLRERADVPESGTGSEGRGVRRALGEQPVKAAEVGVRAVRSVQTFVRCVLAHQRQPERAVSVARELVYDAVGRNPREVAGQSEGEKRENRGVGEGKGEAVPAGCLYAPRWAKESSKNDEGDGGDDTDAAEDETGVVALPDVTDDLRREEQVVHCDEVEPPVELLEEEELRGGDEEREAERRRKAQREHGAHAAFHEPPARQESEEENERGGEPEGGLQVEERPVANARTSSAGDAEARKAGCAASAIRVKKEISQNVETAITAARHRGAEDVRFTSEID